MSDVGSIQGNPGGGLLATEGARARRAPKGSGGSGGGGIAQRILNHFDQQGVSRRTVKAVAHGVTSHLYGPDATRDEYQHVFNRVVNLLKKNGEGSPEGPGRAVDTVG